MPFFQKRGGRRTGMKTELETLADEADVNVIRMWEKEMK